MEAIVLAGFVALAASFRIIVIEHRQKKAAKAVFSKPTFSRYYNFR